MTYIFQNVYKSYGEKEVLKGLSIDFNQEKIYCLTGGSGCGKTTCFRLMAGLEEPDQGEISGFGKCSYVFQEDRLINHLSAIKNLTILGCSKKEAEEMLLSLGIEKEFLKTSVKKLSGGMKRRVAIARALIYPGDFYIFDEPFTGIDEKNKVLVIKKIKEITKEKTVIYTTHILEEAESMGGRMIKIN